VCSYRRHTLRPYLAALPGSCRKVTTRQAHWSVGGRHAPWLLAMKLHLLVRSVDRHDD